jgi:hypothetical protein
MIADRQGISDQIGRDIELAALALLSFSSSFSRISLAVHVGRAVSQEKVMESLCSTSTEILPDFTDRIGLLIHAAGAHAEIRASQPADGKRS